MATTKFDIKSEALKPVMAGVGVTDLAVEIVRDAVADVQKRVSAVQKTTMDRKALREQAEARMTELQTEAKAYPAKVSSLVDDNVAAATAAYADLVKRGELLVDRIRRQESTTATVKSAKTTVTKAKTTATQTKLAADAEVTATQKVAAAQRTAAKKAADKKAADKLAAEKTAKKTADAARKAPARKAATKKTETAQSSAKATVTAAEKTATNAVKAVTDAAEKIGD